MMPKIAEGDANKVWIVPSEITKALEGLGSSLHEVAGIPKHTGGPRTRVDMGSTEREKLGGSGALHDRELSEANQAVQEAIAAAEDAAGPTGGDVPPAAADVPPADAAPPADPPPAPPAS